ncbi:hypothetical protein CEXT_146651 [Caerostris extrusa]|uniref:Uncharacterized protein n=1 Tax=Caerostris extrusa TaxID=172846 RepID=A0AAV4QVY9_CAEEX|nr:hypothetical protein CEXT_146651 [Caerostris extrusa]
MSDYIEKNEASNNTKTREKGNINPYRYKETGASTFRFSQVNSKHASPDLFEEKHSSNILQMPGTPYIIGNL